MMKRFAILLAMFGLVGTARADLRDTDFGIFRPQIGIRAGGNNLAEGFSDYGGQLNAMVPFGEWLQHEKEYTFHQMLGFANGRIWRPDLPFLSSNPTLISGGASVAWLMLTQHLNLFVLSPGFSFSESTDTFDQFLPRFAFTGLGTYRVGDHFTWLYGLSFSYLFGRPLVFPLFGLMYKFAEHWTFNTVFPVTVRFVYRPDRDFSLSLNTGFAGDRSRIENAGQFPGHDEPVNLKIADLRVGADATYRLNSNIALKGSLGFVAWRRYALADGNDEFLTDTEKKSGYVNVGIDFTFGESIFDRLEQWKEGRMEN